MCALAKSKVVAGQDTETRLLNVIQCCPEMPVLCGKHAKPQDTALIIITLMITRQILLQLVPPLNCDTLQVELVKK